MGLLVGFKDYLRERHQEKIQGIQRGIQLYVNDLARKHEFYNVDNDFETNERVLKIHKLYIDAAINKYRRQIVKYCSAEELTQIKAELIETAVLWDEFRKQGLKMDKDRLDSLIEIEEKTSEVGGNVDKLREMMALSENNERITLKQKESTVNSEKARSEEAVKEISTQKDVGSAR